MTAKQLVRDYLQTVWAERDIDAVDRFMSPELAEHNPALPTGPSRSWVSSGSCSANCRDEPRGAGHSQSNHSAR